MRFPSALSCARPGRLATLATLAARVMLAGPLATPAVAAEGSGAPALPREFRACWIASKGNIDWPSQPGLPPARQQAELRQILDQARLLRLNAVILQVRPQADALYVSRLEPWSAYLTGREGVGPATA
ncbi:MAG: family 10 glycosylhydrolase, partial [Verrucomicrobiota bacterium]